MSLELDKRQRAMLREMGVQVWLPESPPAAQVPRVAAPATPPTPPISATPAPPLNRLPVTPPASPELPVPVPSRVVTSAAASDAASPWHLGASQKLYADTAVPDAARWLVLTEMPGDAGPEHRFQSDAGVLLDNMLRAARLHLASEAWLAPLVRHGAGSMDAALQAELAALVARVQPHVVLMMGRFVSQALLNTGDHLGKLRGQAHVWNNARVVVTYDASYLLRTPDDKAKAWQDLRLAMRLAQAS